MLRASYSADDDRAIIQEVTGDQSKRSPASAERRVQNLFDGAPTCGGHEWKTLSADEIAGLCYKAAKEICAKRQAQRDLAVQKHLSCLVLIQIWREVTGWRPPLVPTQKEVLDGIIQQCRSLSDWVKKEQNQPLDDKGIELYIYIWKPLRVAEILALGLTQ